MRCGLHESYMKGTSFYCVFLQVRILTNPGIDYKLSPDVKRTIC